MAVDDDGPVLAAVVRDLRRRYAARFRILPTSDSLAALSTLEELAPAEDPVALIVADQRMPALSGTELLTRSRTLHPRRPRRPADRVRRHRRRDRGDQQDPPRPVHPQAVEDDGSGIRARCS
jgi:CheY-like chemotaxis protein